MAPNIQIVQCSKTVHCAWYPQNAVFTCNIINTLYKRVHFWKGHGPAQPCLFPKLHERSDLIALVCQRSRCAVPRAIASPRRAVPPVLLPMYIVRAQNSESRNLIGRIPPITALHFSESSCTCDRFRVFVQYLSFVCTVSQFWCTLRLPVASCHASF